MRLIRNEFIKEINIYKIMVAIVIFVLVSFAVIRYNYGGKNEPSYRDQLGAVESQLNNAEGEYAQKPTADNLKTVYVYRLAVELEMTAVEKHILIGSWEDIILTSLSQEHNDLASLKLLNEGVDPTVFKGGTQYDGIDVESEYKGKLNNRTYLLDMVLNKKYYDYVSFEIDNIKKDNDKIKKLIDAGDEGYLAFGKNLIARNNEWIKIKQYLVEHKVTSNQDVMVRDAQELESIADVKYTAELDLVSKEKFKLDYDLKTAYHDYDNYKRIVNGKIAKANETEKITWYAMEHRIELTNKTKQMMDLFFNLFILVTLAIITIFGSILSKEYRSGSIKLLLIRGVKRFKIILSKYITVILSTYGLIILFLLIHMGITMYYMNISDLFIPKLTMINGNVTEINYFLYLLIKSFVVSLPCLFFITLTFLLSIIITNNVVSTSIGVFLASCSSIFSYVWISILFKFNLMILKYTPLPYLDMGPWLSSSEDQYSNNFIYNFNINWGITLLILSIIVIYIGTHIIFIRKDVRS